MAFGVSFTDAFQNQPQQQPGFGSPGAGAAPFQSAVQLLSLRLPRVVGANALAPAPLLQGQGAGGIPPDLWSQLMQYFGQGGAGGGMGRTPRVVPGTQPQQAPGPLGGGPQPFPTPPGGPMPGNPMQPQPMPNDPGGRPWPGNPYTPQPFPGSPMGRPRPTLGRQTPSY